MAKGAYIGVEKTIYLNSLGDVAVGSTVKINENGSPVEFFVATHDYESELNGSGRTLLVRKTVTTEGTQWQGAAGNAYRTGAMIVNWFSNSYKPKLDTLVQENLSTTYIRSCDGNGSSNVSVVGFPVFALSVTELGLSGGDVPVEGSKLPIADTLRSLNDYDQSSGSNLQEWTRTPEKGGNQFVFYEYSGDVYQQYASGYFYKLRPCFTLPASLGVGDDNLITGAQAESTTQSVARKIKKGYIGVDGKARKIKKAYIGIGGVARPCWSGGELTYYGTITGLSQGRAKVDTAKVGESYALFTGGTAQNGAVSTVDAYDTSLTRSVPSALPYTNSDSGTATVGDCALIAGGTGGSMGTGAVQKYDASLTRSQLSYGLYTPKYSLAGASINGYAIFAGGWATGSTHSILNVEAFNASFTRTLVALSVARYELKGTAINNYALFGGGYNDSTSVHHTTVDVFDISLTLTSIDSLAKGGMQISATATQYHALFGGNGTTVTAYDASLTKTVPTELSVSQYDAGATSIANFAMFGGGNSSGSTVIDTYDESLTKSSNLALSVARYDVNSAVTIGNYALFGGGKNLVNYAWQHYDVVDAYVVA